MGGRCAQSCLLLDPRHLDERGRLGNRVSAVFSKTSQWDSMIRSIGSMPSQHFVALKNSGTALGVDALQGAADLVPGSLFALGVKTWAHSPQRIFSTVTTNVPGPQQPLYLLGRRMTELYPYIPLGVDLRITIGVASYAGGLAWGITGGPRLRPRPPRAVGRLQQAITELIALSTPPANTPPTFSEVRHA